jgi:hypothetical protein
MKTEFKFHIEPEKEIAETNVEIRMRLQRVQTPGPYQCLAITDPLLLMNLRVLKPFKFAINHCYGHSEKSICEWLNTISRDGGQQRAHIEHEPNAQSLWNIHPV